MAYSASRRSPPARKIDELAFTRAYTRLGEALALDWAQQQVARFVPTNQWERLLTAGLARDFEQLRIEFLARAGGERRMRPSTSGSRISGRGSNSFASLSPGREPKAMSARRCSRKSPGRRGFCSPASPAAVVQPLVARANSHWRMADVRFGGGLASRRAASISATRALTGCAARAPPVRAPSRTAAPG